LEIDPGKGREYQAERNLAPLILKLAYDAKILLFSRHTTIKANIFHSSYPAFK
jgi:hypothetical protein